jgi:hypothetical protein
MGLHAFSWSEQSSTEAMTAVTQGRPGQALEAPGVLALYCSSCHRQGRARIDLDGPVDSLMLSQDRSSWEKVLYMLRAREMPPPDQAQPSPEERDRLIHWVEQRIAEGSQDSTPASRLLVRRLQRTEYVNTIRDLAGVRFQPAPDFPADDTAWHPCRDLPSLPRPLKKAYLAAAEKVLAQATPCSPVPESQAEHARALLAAFARRAYRRALDPDEVAGLGAVFDQAVRAGSSVDEGIKAAFKVILTSPHFLYRIDMPYDADGPRTGAARGRFALASRLSFFLWQSMPDEELLDLAERGVLRQDLDGQCQRMLRDSRARHFAAAFADSWLELRNLRAVPGLEPALVPAMRRETEQFVDCVIREDRSALELLDADYTFLNERLARHYGIAGVRGEEMRRVSVAGTPRGGLLTQASILMLSSPTGQTSPVRRGKWVLDHLLGTPPPAPPKGLLEAFSKTRRAFAPGTARQLLEQHRANPSCAHCHAKLDGFGFALENFDIAGRWRTQDNHRPIDASATLPDGVSFKGPRGLKAYLQGKKELFIRCLSGELLRHALGRPLRASDRAALARIPKRVAATGHRFSSVVVEVVRSRPFQLDSGQR